MIDLYTAATPNGHKVSIVLKEFAMPCNVRGLSFDKKEKTAPTLLKNAARGRMAAIAERASGDFRVSDSLTLQGAQAMLIR